MAQHNQVVSYNYPLTIEVRGKNKMKTYVFKAEVEQDDDGRWGAEIPSLPGCATWGYTKEEALEALQDAAQAYLEDMIEAGDEIPTKDVEIIEVPVVTVTL
jgi:predicted RNase H-like HicB family nuclease